MMPSAPLGDDIVVAALSVHFRPFSPSSVNSVLNDLTAPPREGEDVNDLGGEEQAHTGEGGNEKAGENVLHVGEHGGERPVAVNDDHDGAARGQ